jgi:HAD superfamily hydrolase (TIGR01458 family)
MDRRGLLIDIDGVLAVSWKAVPGAVAAFRRLRGAGYPMVFVTNTTSRSRTAIAEALRAAGFAVDAGQILTAPIMTADFLRTRFPSARCWALGDGDVTGDLDGVRLVDREELPDVVVLGGAGSVFDYPALNRVFQLAVAGIPVVAMHRNLFWSTEEGLQLDTGAFVDAIELITVGKPSAPAFEAGLRALGVTADQAVMVGDDLDADVRGAQRAGIRAVLVRTGKFRADRLTGVDRQPDDIVDSFADVPGLLGL